MKLYYHPKTRSMRPHIMLEELGVECERVFVDFDAGEHKSEKYLAVHPLGQLPALDDGGVILIESVAICMYLADKFPEKKLAPALDSIERGLYYQWCVYTVGSFEPILIENFHVREGRLDADNSEDKMTAMLSIIEAGLGGRDYLLPSGFSTADILIGSTLTWISMMGTPLSDTLRAYVRNLGERPSFRRVFAAAENSAPGARNGARS